MNSVAEWLSDILQAFQDLHWAVLLCVALGFAILAIVSEYVLLRKKFKKMEAMLLDRSIGTHSRNWTATALNLEKKAQEPGDVARSSALTYLHLMDEAAEAWLKGSQWQDAHRVTQQLLLQCAHAIGSPGFGENEFRASADLIEYRLKGYADLSKAANEAPDNAIIFLRSLDVMLSIHDPAPRINQLRDMIEETGVAVQKEDGEKFAKAS